MIRHWFSKQAGNSRRPQRTLLRLDALEERTVPTVLNMYITSGSLTLSGTVTHPLGTSNITQQGAGSLVTNYIGYVISDYDAGARTLALDFNGYAFALNSGNWQPAVGGGAGSAPANYGGQVSIPLFGTGRAAVRELIVGQGTLSPLPLTVSGIGFSFPSTQYLAIYYGFADYNAPVGGSGRADLTGAVAVNTAAAGTFIDYGPYGYAGYFSIRLPIDLTINEDLGSGNSATLRIRGTIEAWAFPGSGPSGGSGIGQTPAGDAAQAFVGLAQTVATPFAVALTSLEQPTLTVDVSATQQPERAVSAASPTAEGAPVRHQAALEQVFTDLLSNELVIA